MSTAVVNAVATCPVHGIRTFRRVSECAWWECPETRMLEPGTCGSVIPDELLTPDGASVVHWSTNTWVRDGSGDERRVWRP